MKKLFTLLTAVLLSAGMVVQAQLLSAVNDSPEGGYLFDENGQVSGRHNAPMATYEQSFTWNEFYSISNPNGGSNWTECQLYFRRDGNSYPDLRLIFLIQDDGSRTYNNAGNNYVFPQNGTYTIRASKNLWSIGGYGNTWTSTYDANFHPTSDKIYYLQSGTVNVYDGHRHNDKKPYIVVNSTANVNSSGNTVNSGTYISAYFTIGEPVYTYYIATATTNSSYGTAGASTSSVEEGGSVTLTATPTNGIFQGWSLDGGNTIIGGTSDQTSYTVTLDADAGSNGQTFTYTAVFTSNVGGAITITAGDNGQVKLDNGSWGATFTGNYNGGDNVTIAAQANDGYLFYRWTDSENNTKNTTPYAFKVSGDNTYTAEFRRAYTINKAVNNSSYGTVSITEPYRDGKYYDGQSVTLTANAANILYSFTQWSDGNTENPRTITVNSSAAAVTYTAQFDEIDAIQIIDDEGVLYNKSYGFFEGTGNGYAFHFESKNAPISVNPNFTAIDQDYTKLFASENWTNQVSINFSTMTVSISRVYVTATMYLYMLESTFEDTAGQLYYVRIKAIGPMTADQVSTNANVDWTSDPGTLSSGPTLTKVADRRYRLEVEGGNFSGFSYGHDAQIDFILDDEDVIDGNILPGVYPISYTGESHTVAMAEYPSFSYTDSYSTSSYSVSFDGSYARQMYIGTSLGNVWWYYLCGGTVTVTKSGDTYNIAVDAICSAANPNVTYPSAYYTIRFNVSGVPAPSVIPTHTATFYDSDGETVLGTRTLTAGSALAAPEVSKSGCEFVGWTPAVAATMPNRDIAYTAVWSSLSTHTISITSPTNGSITVSYNDGSEQSFTSGSRDIAENTVLTVTTTPAADYHFTGWTDDGAASVTVNADKTIGATFAQNDYFLNATYGTGGASVGRDDGGNSETVKRAGNTVTITPTAATGYEFLTWGGDDAANMSGNVFTFPTNGTHNTTYNVQATFQATEYTITYYDNGGYGSINTVYTIEDTPIELPTAEDMTKDGYEFAGWYANSDLTTGGVVTTIPANSTGAKEFWAAWTAKTYSITLNANGGTADGSATATYDSNELIVSSHATKYGSWSLKGYYTADEGGTKVINANGTLVANVDGYTDASGHWTRDGGATLYAQWTENITYYNVSFAGEGTHFRSVTAKAGGETITSDASVTAGTQVELTAEPKNFYHFKEWQNAVGTTVSSANPYSVSLSGDLNLTAVFERDEVIVLEDTYKSDNIWYTDYAELVEDLNESDSKVTVRYNRTLSANTWNVFSLPFNYSTLKAGSTFKGSVYRLDRMEYNINGEMTLNFLPATQISANRPYLFYSSEPAENPTFAGVELQSIADGSYDTNNSGNAGGKIWFRNTQARTQLDFDKDADAKKKVIYLNANKLYYLSLTKETWMRAFRGYFELDETSVYYLQPRVRIVLDGQTATEIEAVGQDDSNSDVSKYIENGRLVIEREGVKYDATGARIN